MKVVTFGEIMLRLAPEGYLRFAQSDKLEATYGGGEANVAVSLANWGIQSKFVTKLPNNDIAKGAVDNLRKYGVDTGGIVIGGERIGIYFLEKGASQRPSKVIYDRANSAIAKAKQDDFDFYRILSDADWFHLTGITPALSDELAQICENALRVAKELNIKVSCDLNYRKKLWCKEKANKVMNKLMKYVDVLIANEEDSKDVFGISAAHTDITSGKISRDGYKEVASQLVKKFDFSYVAITLRKSISANDNIWSSMLYDGDNYYFSNEYNIHIVDRVGGGDSFGAGLIYGMLNYQDNQQIIDFATAASCLKHTIQGDFNLVSVDEVVRLAGGDGSGRVQR